MTNNEFISVLRYTIKETKSKLRRKAKSTYNDDECVPAESG